MQGIILDEWHDVFNSICSLGFLTGVNGGSMIEFDNEFLGKIIGERVSVYFAANYASNVIYNRYIDDPDRWIPSLVLGDVYLNYRS